MIISDTVTTVSLPDDLQWTDEYAWSAVEQTTEYSVTGALVVDVAERVAGRPVTLVSGDQVWVSRATLDQLLTLANQPGKVMSLTLADDRVFQVMFRLHAGAGIDARPVLFSAPMAAGDWYTLTLNLMEV